MTENRSAYRLAYEEGIRSRGGLADLLEQYRTRVTGFFIADFVAAGAALSGLQRSLQTPSLSWLMMVGLDVSCTFAAAVWLLWEVRGPFRNSSQALVVYGDSDDLYPTNDDVYRDLSLWLHRTNRRLSRTIARRCRAIYVSILERRRPRTRLPRPLELWVSFPFVHDAESLARVAVQNLYHLARIAWAPVPVDRSSPYSWPSYDVEEFAASLVARLAEPTRPLGIGSLSARLNCELSHRIKAWNQRSSRHTARTLRTK